MTSVQSQPTEDSPLLSVRTDLGDVVTVYVDGEIDCSSAPYLEAAIEQALSPGNDVRVDMSQVEFMDSAGLGALIRSYKLAAEAGGCVRIVNPSSAVERVLTITGQASRFIAE